MSIKLAVIEALDADPDVRAAALGVLVEAGRVTLIGSAGSDGQRRLALEAAFTVSGASVTVDAMDVDDGHVDVALRERQRRAAGALAAVLERWATADALPVRAVVAAGRVSLRGRLPGADSVPTLVAEARAVTDLPVDAEGVLAP